MTRRPSGWYLSCALLELLGLMIWIGGFAAILTMVIPAVFNTMDVETGGRFLRRVFDGYHAVTGGIAILLIGTALFRYWKHRREPERSPPPGRSEIGLLTALALVTFLIVAVAGPQAVGLQEAAFAAESREIRQAAFDDFFQLHMIVRALHMINAGLAVGLLVAAFLRWMRHRHAFDGSRAS